MATIKTYSTTLFAVALLGLTTAWAQSPSVLIGTWHTADSTASHITFYLDRNGFYYGKSLRDNKIIFEKLIYTSATNRFEGTMKPSTKDTEIAAAIDVIANNQLKVTARKFFMTKTLYLTRIP